MIQFTSKIDYANAALLYLGKNSALIGLGVDEDMYDLVTVKIGNLDGKVLSALMAFLQELPEPNRLSVPEMHLGERSQEGISWLPLSLIHPFAADQGEPNIMFGLYYSPSAGWHMYREEMQYTFNFSEDEKNAEHISEESGADS